MWVHCLVPDFLPGEQETVVPREVYVFGVVLHVESSLGPGPTTPGEQAGFAILLALMRLLTSILLVTVLLLITIMHVVIFVATV